MNWIFITTGSLAGLMRLSHPLKSRDAAFSSGRRSLQVNPDPFPHVSTPISME
jgi:hypothetical protein